MADLVTPGGRGEFVATLPGGGEEGDADVVDGVGVRPQWTSDLLGTQKRVAKQVSGIARAGAESATASDSAQASATESAHEPVTVTPTEGGASSPEAAAKEFSFEQQP